MGVLTNEGRGLMELALDDARREDMANCRMRRTRAGRRRRHCRHGSIEVGSWRPRSRSGSIEAGSWRPRSRSGSMRQRAGDLEVEMRVMSRVDHDWRLLAGSPAQSGASVHARSSSIYRVEHGSWVESRMQCRDRGRYRITGAGGLSRIQEHRQW